MKRRKALKLTASMMGVAIVGSELFLSGCANEPKEAELFSNSDIDLLGEIGETILPHTNRSPGAKSAKIGLFMQVIVTDCYSEKEQTTFKTGIDTLKNMASDMYSKDFLNLDQKQKHDLLVSLDKEVSSTMNKEPIHFFSMMKQLTIWGYFSSEPGVTKALRYNPVPGEFKGCIPYKEGDKAWA